MSSIKSERSVCTACLLLSRPPSQHHARENGVCKLNGLLCFGVTKASDSKESPTNRGVKDSNRFGLCVQEGDLRTGTRDLSLQETAVKILSRA